tara:strand:- start:2029 stop:2151 length:123 start_codon:yes stop_codon:yes gene_type:complete
MEEFKKYCKEAGLDYKEILESLVFKWLRRERRFGVIKRRY